MLMGARLLSFESGVGQRNVPTVAVVVPLRLAKLNSGRPVGEVVAWTAGEIRNFIC
jgi:hypothetical protein